MYLDHPQLLDNLVERLAKTKIDLVRLGHAARVLPKILDHTLDVRLRTCDEGKIVIDVRQEMDKILSSISKCKSRSEKREKFNEIKLLRKEVLSILHSILDINYFSCKLISREAKVISTILNNANVVLCTLNGAANFKVDRLVNEKGLFDVVVIDEASQALEVECWIAILKSKKLILAGDHLQLPVNFFD